MEADAGFVEDIEHIHQLGANLGSQSDALRLAAAQRLAAAIEREIADADIEHKLHSDLYLTYDFVCHRLLSSFEFWLQSFYPGIQLRQIHSCHLADVHSVNQETEAFVPQSRTVTMGTRDGVHEVLCPFLQSCRAVVRRHLLYVVGYTLEAATIGALILFSHTRKVACAIEDSVAGIVAHLLYRCVDRETVIQTQPLQLTVKSAIGVVFPKGVKRPFAYTLLGVGNQLGQIDLRHLAQSVAMGTGAIGGVEREGVGFGFRERLARVRIHQLTTEIARFV